MPVLQVDEEDGAARKATNAGWCWGFGVFTCLCLLVAMHGIINGTPSKLGRGFAFNGLACGVDDGVKNRPFLYIPLDPSSDYKLSLLVDDGRCVASCPSVEDVSAKRLIPMTKRVTKQHKDLPSKVVVEFEVATAVYATDVIANAYCIPLDPKLKAQFRRHVVRSSQLSFAISSITAAWPLILSRSTIALFLGVLSTIAVRQLPIVTVVGSSLASGVVMIVCGATCLFWSQRVPQHQQLLSSMFSANDAWMIVFGVILLGFGVLTLFNFSKSHGERSRACRALDFCGAVFADMPNLIAAPVLIALVMFFVAWSWIVIFVHVCGLSAVTTIPDSLADGDLMASLHRMTVFPASGFFSVMVWLAFLFWTLQMLQSLSQFSVCYAAPVWYFAPPEGCDEKNVGWCPGLIGCNMALTHHFGSLAVGGFSMGMTAPVRAFAGWAAQKNEYCYDEIDMFWSTVMAPVKGMARSIVDFFSVAGFVEIAISSNHFSDAMSTSSRRLGVPSSPSARLFGCLDNTMRNLTIALALPIAMSTYATVAGPLYTAPVSAHFTAFPAFIAFITFVLSYSYVRLFTCMWSCLCDALFYSYLLESSASNGDVDENPNDKMHATQFQRTLIMEIMQEVLY